MNNSQDDFKRTTHNNVRIWDVYATRTDARSRNNLINFNDTFIEIAMAYINMKRTAYARHPLQI